MERRKQDRLGIALIAASVASMLALFGLGWARDAFREARDPSSGCRTDAPPAGYSALIVDQTDVLSDAQRARLAEERDRILARVGPDAMVAIYVVNEHAGPLLVPELALCSPGAGRDANPLYQNPRKRDAHFRQQFAERLDAVVARLEQPHTSATSPILEAIQAVAAAEAFQRATGPRELVIVSDLLENVPAFSHYRAAPSFERFRASRYAARVAADLRGAALRLVYLRRERDLERQGEPHLAFWRQYFGASGAGSVDVLFQ